MSAPSNQQGDSSGLPAILEVIRREQSFVLTTHRDPDGDGLGAESALAEALAQLGKRVQVVNNNPVPAHYRYLSGSPAFQVYQPDQHDSVIIRSDAIVLLDAALPERTGRLEPALRRVHGVTLAIDHHPGGGWAQVEMIDPERSATVELVDEILTGLSVSLTPSMAEALYTGLVADTQSFHGANTTPQTHALAARLLQAGASPERVHRAIYQSWDLERLQLLGRFLGTLQTALGGLVVWGAVTQADLKHSRRTPEDIEGFVEQIFTVKDAKVAVLFLEEPGEAVRVSLRSREGVEVGPLAAALNGGGHLRAAGARLRGTLDDGIDRVLAKAAELLVQGALAGGPPAEHGSAGV
jgi:phosphoesterase RecJ-like protein